MLGAGQHEPTLLGQPSHPSMSLPNSGREELADLASNVNLRIAVETSIHDTAAPEIYSVGGQPAAASLAPCSSPLIHNLVSLPQVRHRLHQIDVEFTRRLHQIDMELHQHVEKTEKHEGTLVTVTMANNEIDLRLQALEKLVAEHHELLVSASARTAENEMSPERATSTQHESLSCLHSAFEVQHIAIPNLQGTGRGYVSSMRRARASRTTRNHRESSIQDGEQPVTRSSSSTNFRESCDTSYAFKESIWDAAIFIGARCYGAGASVLISLVLVVTLLVQILYIVLVMTEFTGSTYDETTVDAFKKFRVRIAHDYKYLDPVSEVSLVAKICAEDLVLEVATQQVEAISAINKYLPQKETGIGVGPLLCCLACMQWCLVVQCEFKAIGELATSVLKRYTQSDRVSKTRVLTDETGWIIIGLSFSRLCIIAAMLTVRLVVAALLLAGGLLYIINTIELRDLVLNAIALECMLQLDELFFAAFAPVQIANFLGSLEQLPLPQWCTLHGIDLQSILGLFGCSLILGTLVPMWLTSEIQVLRDIRETMCGGEQNFVRTSLLVPPYYVWSKTNLISDTATINHLDERLTDELASGQQNNFSLRGETKTIKGSSIYSMKALTGWTVQQSASWYNAVCVDQLDAYTTQVSFQILASLVGSTGISKCADLFPFCSEDSTGGEAARIFCPITCGCNLPNSTLVLTKPDFGCPEACSRRPAYLDVLAHASCVDQSREALASDVAWTARASIPVQIAVQRQWALGLQSILRSINHSMITYGCKAIKRVTEADLCEDYSRFPFLSLRLFCPVTCACKASYPGCPHHCPL